MKKKIGAFSWVLISNVVMSFLKWAIIVIIARFGTQESLGVYSLVFALVAPFTVFSNYRLRGIFVSANDPNIKNFIFIRIFLDILVFTILICISIVFYKLYLITIILISLIKILDLSSELVYSIPHYFKNYKQYSLLIIFKNLLTFSMFSLTYYYFVNLNLSLLIMLITQICFLIFEILFVKHRYIDNSIVKFIKVDFLTVKQFLMIGFPLAVSLSVVSLNASIPRLVLENKYDLETLGIFSAISYIALMANLFVSAITQNLLPVIKKWKNNKEFNKIDKLLGIYCILPISILSILIYLFTIFLGDKLIIIIYGQEYKDQQYLFFLIVLGIMINAYSAIVDNVLLSLRLVKMQLFISFVVILFTTLSSFYFIRVYGLYGAALVMILSNTLQLLLRLLYYWKFRKYGDNNNEIFL